MDGGGKPLFPTCKLPYLEAFNSRCFFLICEADCLERFNTHSLAGQEEGLAPAALLIRFLNSLAS